VLTKSWSALPRSTTEVAGDDLDGGRCGGIAHRGDDAPQRLQGKPLLQDEAGAEKERAGAAHGEVVDRAVDRQCSDVAAGEEQRLDVKGVGGEGERPRHVQTGTVVTAVEARVAKGRADQRVEEALHRAAAAALGELHGIRRRGGNGTGEREPLIVHLAYSTASAAARRGSGNRRHRRLGETMVTPSGCSGVQRVPKAGHSGGSPRSKADALALPFFLLHHRANRVSASRSW
jgi:hypothetical protein